MSSSSNDKEYKRASARPPTGSSTKRTHASTAAGSRSSQRPIQPNPSGGSNSGYDHATGKMIDHSPTNLPPVSYSGQSRYNPPPKSQRIHPTAANRLQQLDQRITKAEEAVDHYLAIRSQTALNNSQLPRSGSEGNGNGK